MNSAAIYLYGFPGIDKPEALKTIKYNDEKKLIAHLKELQSGYCEGYRPKISKVTQNGKPIIDCHSDADYHYVAFLGMRIKADANKPIEVIN